MTATPESEPSGPVERLRASAGTPLRDFSSRRLVVTALVIVAAASLMLWTYGVVRHFLFLLLLAWLVAVAMEPAIGFLLRHRMKRGAATATTGISLAVVVVALVFVFGRIFIEQLVDLVEALPGLVSEVVDWLNSTFGFSFDAAQVVDNLQVGSGGLGGAVSSLAGGVLGAAGSLLSVGIDCVTIVVFALYFAASGPKVLLAVLRWLPPSRQQVARDVWQVTATKTGGFVVSKVVLAALSTAFHGVFFLIIDVPYWLPMAMLVGITAQFVPMIGTYIGIAVPVLVSLFNDPLDAVWIILFATVYQQIESYVFTPKVSQRTMDVHPAIALAAVFVGAAIWGPIGALIGIPLVAAALALVDTYGRRYALAPDEPGLDVPG